MSIRIVVAVKRVGSGLYQAQLRQAAGCTLLFFSRQVDRNSAAKREAERPFGALRWQEQPEPLKRRGPQVNQVAYLNLEAL